MFCFLICTKACAGSKMCGNRFNCHLCVENSLLFGYVVERQWNNKSVVNKECCFAPKYETFAVWWARSHCKMLTGFVGAMELGADVTLTNTGLFLTHRQRGRWLWALHSMPPPWKHGQAAGADKVYEEGAASPLQGLQKCRSGCSIECSHWYKDINLQTNVVKVLYPLWNSMQFSPGLRELRLLHSDLFILCKIGTNEFSQLPRSVQAGWWMRRTSRPFTPSSFRREVRCQLSALNLQSSRCVVLFTP